MVVPLGSSNLKSLSRPDSDTWSMLVRMPSPASALASDGRSSCGATWNAIWRASARRRAQDDAKVAEPADKQHPVLVPCQRHEADHAGVGVGLPLHIRRFECGVAEPPDPDHRWHPRPFAPQHDRPRRGRATARTESRDRTEVCPGRGRRRFHEFVNRRRHALSPWNNRDLQVLDTSVPLFALGGCALNRSGAAIQRKRNTA